MPAPGPTLAGGAAAGQAASGRCGQNRARREATCAPATRPISAASTDDPRACGGAWSRSKNFVADALVRPARVPRTAPEVGPPPGTLLLPHLPSGAAQGAGSRTQVAFTRHFPGPPRTRPGVPGSPCATLRRPARPSPHATTTGVAPVTRPTGRAGRQWFAAPRKLPNLGQGFEGDPVLAQQVSQA